MVEDLKKRVSENTSVAEKQSTHSLGESLSTGSLSEIGVETERLGNGQVSYGLVWDMNIDRYHE
jgi:hypothetical protein